MAISTQFGLFEFLRMPFGLHNSGQTFQRFINSVLHGLEFCHVYLDDLLIASRSPEQHEEHLRTVFQRLTEHGIIVNTAKCELGVCELSFLGHLISSSGIRPPPEKAQAVGKFPQPNTRHQLREFLGLVNFYRCFVPQCAAILHPLHTDDAATAFQRIKDSLADATLLAYSQPGIPQCVMVDASDTAVGAALLQLNNGMWRPTAFFSRKLTPTERCYSRLRSNQALPLFPGRSGIFWCDGP